MSDHRAWAEGPDCDPACPGAESQWHDGYAWGLEQGSAPVEPMTSKCGCPCKCHSGEHKPEWPGPCEACCTPEWGPLCECIRGIALAALREPPKPMTSKRNVSRLAKAVGDALRGDEGTSYDWDWWDNPDVLGRVAERLVAAGVGFVEPMTRKRNVSRLARVLARRADKTDTWVLLPKQMQDLWRKDAAAIVEALEKADETARDSILGAALTRVEEALPKEWDLRVEVSRQPDDVLAQLIRWDRTPLASGRGPDLAAALRDLAAKLEAMPE